jgi:hypothetical protein
MGKGCVPHLFIKIYKKLKFEHGNRKCAINHDIEIKVLLLLSFESLPPLSRTLFKSASTFWSTSKVCCHFQVTVLLCNKQNKENVKVMLNLRDIIS